MESFKQSRIAIANNSEKSREYATKLKDIKQEDINKRKRCINNNERRYLTHYIDNQIKMFNKFTIDLMKNEDRNKKEK